MNRYIVKTCIVCLLMFSIGWSNTYYIKNGGGGGGTSSDPFSTIAQVQSAVSAGDTVYFDRASTWNTISGNAVLVPTPGVTYIGDEWGTGTRATFSASAAMNDANGTGIVHFSSDHATIPTVVQGFEIDGQSNAVNLVNVLPASGNMTGAVKRIENCKAHNTGGGTDVYRYGIKIAPYSGRNVANVEIIDNEVYETAWSAITVYPYYVGTTNSVSNVIIRGNYVHTTSGPQGSHGIMVCGDKVDDVIIEYNYVKDTYNYGLEFASKTAQGMHGIIARYNIVTGCSRAVDFWVQSPGNDFEVSIYGNIFMNNPDGMRFSSGLSGINMALRIYNNIFYNNGGTAEIYIDQSPDFSVFEVINNIFSSSKPAMSGYTNLITSQSNNLTSNPGFKNTSNLPSGFTGTYGVDLRPDNDGLSIVTGGAAIDAGADLGLEYAASINSMNRTGSWDIGAYEYGSVAPPALSVTTDTLPNAGVGVAYSHALAATGGTSPYTWSVSSGSLPAGLSLSSSGTITGTPTAAGRATCSVQVTDADDSSATREFTLDVLNEGELNLANGTTYLDDSQNFAASNPVEGLWDGFVGEASVHPGNIGVDSFWVEYDIGGVYDLSRICFYGDSVGTWVSKTYSVLAKTDEAGDYTSIIDHEDCFSNDMRQTVPSNVSARYLKLVVIGDTVAHAVQCREFEVFGTVSTTAIAGYEGYPRNNNLFRVSGNDIQYALSNASHVLLGIFNVSGRMVRELVDKEQAAGAYQITWQTEDFPQGIFVCCMKAGTDMCVKKIYMVR